MKFSKIEQKKKVSVKKKVDLCFKKKLLANISESLLAKNLIFSPIDFHISYVILKIGVKLNQY